MSSARFARIAAPVLFVACAADEIARVVLGRPWAGFVPAASNVVGLGLAAVWLASAVMVARNATKALYVVVVGSFALLAHAVITRAAGSTLGLVYLGVAPVVVLLERIAFGPRLTWSARTEQPVHT